MPVVSVAAAHARGSGPRIDDAGGTAEVPEDPLNERRVRACWVGRGSAGRGHDPGPFGARRGEHTVVSPQVGARLVHQCRKTGHEVLRREDHVRGAVAIRRLQRVAHLPAPGQRQPLGGDRGPCDGHFAFDIDMQNCPNCGAGELKIIAAILERPVIAKILTHLGQDAQPPPRGRARGAGQDFAT
jgi:hypothetical protein